jgi:sugar lactone lactonase YvrE
VLEFETTRLDRVGFFQSYWIVLPCNGEIRLAWLGAAPKSQLVAVDADGKAEVMLRVSTTFPFSIDWLPDGKLLVVSGRERLLLRRETDGSLVTHADLSAVVEGACNEIVVDGRGSIYVNGGAGSIVLVRPDGSTQRVVPVDLKKIRRQTRDVLVV